jgi:predicted nucleotidyltransferase
MQKRLLNSVRIFYPLFKKEELISRLKERTSSLKKELSLKKVILFGSWAKGNSKLSSDIDLLVIYDGKIKKDVFKTLKKIINIPLLEPHVYSEEEYKKIKNKIDKMVDNGIIIYQD